MGHTANCDLTMAFYERKCQVLLMHNNSDLQRGCVLPRVLLA